MPRLLGKYKITVVESERGWGQTYETMYFKTENDARQMITSINELNTDPKVPNWYRSARYDGYVLGVMLDKKFRELK